MPIVSDPSRIDAMAARIYGMNVRLLDIMSAKRLMVLSRCAALKLCMGCGWAPDEEEAIGELELGCSADALLGAMGGLSV